MDPELTHDTTAPPADSNVSLPQKRDGAGAFVTIFTVCVLVLLTGYRFSIGTLASDRYLFEISRHTAWLLDGIGYSAELEKDALTNLDPDAVRATLYGENAQDSSKPPGPLSPWERWRFRAMTQKTSGEMGPRVTFVLWPGLQQAVQVREQQLAQIQQGRETLPPEEIATLEQQVNMLKRRVEEIASDPSSQRERMGTIFNFYVVPSCRAIEIMAIFFAAVLAFPSPWRHRLLGLALGLPLMYLVNILRLACLACLGALDQNGEWFNFVHEYVWQAGYIIFVVLVWMAWVEWGRRRTA